MWGAALRYLRPKKVRNAVRRRWFEQRLRATPVNKIPVVHLGSAYGGWNVPEGLIDASWTCYSVGAGADISFDLELIQRYGARVRSFDPVEEFGGQALDAAGGHDGFSFHHAAIAAADGPLSMCVAERSDHGALSAVNLFRTDRSVEVPGRSLPSLMTELGDERIDLLKLDIEGLEYELIPQLRLRSMGVRLLLFEAHHNGRVRDVRRLLAGLRADGYDVVCRKDPTSFTLLCGPG